MGEASAADIEYEFYERFFLAPGLEPYPVQEQALGHVFRGESVLVTVPTGTGKTLIAKAALHRALRLGRTAVYTTPLRALTEEKYRELCADFGEDRVGFATGDYQVNLAAPVHVVVAEILWNRVYGERRTRPADVVVMDEGHYFNDPERGYVWEQSIIGLDPRAQLVVLTATVGHPERFCQWVTTTRRVPMALVRSDRRQVPLVHAYREATALEAVRELFDAGDWPMIVFVFGREQCFERARLIKSCRRFVDDGERARIAAAADAGLLRRGVAEELRALLLHGVGLHHAGLLPRYKQLVERLTAERLLKVVVSTETIAAGINLPARTVVFPELRKTIRKQQRLLLSAEYHQMAGRAGRPQFDREGHALALAPEEVVGEIRRELREQGRAGVRVDEERVRKSAYARARSEAARAGQVLWDADVHRRLVEGQPAELTSQTRVTAGQILAIGLPDLAAAPLPAPDGAPVEPPADLPPYLDLHVRSVIDHLLLPPRERQQALRRLALVTENLAALGVVDEHGRQVTGEVIAKLQGIDGLFVWYCLQQHDLAYEQARELVEYLIDHDAVQRVLDRRLEDARREWCRARLRERRREEPQVTWEDVEEEWQRTQAPPPTFVEQVHAEFAARLPHPEVHGGKVAKSIWARIETEALSFMDFVEAHGLQHEEGSLFSYLARVMKVAHMIHEATAVPDYDALARAVRACLAAIDERVLAAGSAP